jgi:hypothetical protein
MASGLFEIPKMRVQGMLKIKQWTHQPVKKTRQEKYMHEGGLPSL